MAFHGKEPLADAPAGAGAVEDAQMYVLDVGRAFERHGAAHVDVGGLDFLLFETEGIQHVERGIVQLIGLEAQGIDAKLLAQRPFVEDEADVEGLGQRLLDLGNGLFGELLRFQRLVAEGVGILQCPMADGV